MTDTVRLLAIKVITPLLARQSSLKVQLAAMDSVCSGQDRGLLHELCYGTLRQLPQLEVILKTLLRKPFQKKDLDLQALLLLGIYQLRHTRIPAHAAIHEAVQATRELNKGWAEKLVNAVLRRYQRESKTLEQTLQASPAFQFNHPDWFVAKLRSNWPEYWQQILHNNNQPAPLTLRINLQRISREAYMDLLASQDIAASVTPYSPAGIRLERSCSVTELPGFAEGLFSVQDEAAQLAAGLMDLAPGQRVLDACAAPGGKLCHLLELEPELAQVDAVELDSNRVRRIHENLTRLQLSAQVIIADAGEPDWWDGTPYDRILLDAPCSATGVIRRNPDIKLLRRGEDIHELARIQEKILQNCWKILKPGGKLLYATCSVFPQENERQIERFVTANSDAEHNSLTADWGLNRPFGRQLFPVAGGHDGFYYALITKTG